MPDDKPSPECEKKRVPSYDPRRKSNPPGSMNNPMPGVDPEQTPGIDHVPAERHPSTLK